MLKNSSPATVCTKSASSTCLKTIKNNTTCKNATNSSSTIAATATSTANNNNILAKNHDALKKSAVAKGLEVNQLTSTKSSNTCIKNSSGKQNGTCVKSSNLDVKTPPSNQSTTKPVTVATSTAKCISPSNTKTVAATSQNASTNTSTTSSSTATATNNTCSNGNGPPPPATKVENSELRIIIIDENWSQYCYRIKINTPFGKLINRFCQQVRKIDHKSVLFWYHGRLVEDDDTPKTLNIKDGEVILAHYIK